MQLELSRAQVRALYGLAVQLLRTAQPPHITEDAVTWAAYLAQRAENRWGASWDKDV